MKKLMMIAAVSAFALASCTKDYVCECTDSDGDKESLTIKDAKKKDAKNACDTFGALYTLGGGTCDLK